MKALASRRYFHERTGKPMPAYVIGEFVVEKARRDWDARPYRGSTGNPQHREWWEIRRQGSRTQPGVSIGECLFEGHTLRECKQWIESSPDERELLKIEEMLSWTRDPGIRRTLVEQRKVLRDKIATS